MTTLLHFCEWDRIQRRGRSLAACGDWIEREQISGTPTCPECKRLQALTAEDMFGATSPGRPAVSSPTLDVFDGYRPKDR
jgi:hypothetical protein